MGRKQCTVCTHEERARAELLLAKGDGYAETARKLGMSQDALERHWKRHTTEEMRKALQPGAKALAARLELAGQIAEENTSSLEHLKAARALAWQMVIDEREAGHTALATMALAQYTKIGSLIARINGELADTPLASSPLLQQNNLTIVMQSPEMQEFMRGFEAQMRDLVDAARRMGKPLVF